MSHKYAILFRPAARRALAKLPNADQVRLDKHILSLADDPRPPGCVKLSGQDNLWRVRAGVYRIIYQIEDDRLIVTVIHIAHRREVYRRL